MGCRSPGTRHCPCPSRAGSRSGSELVPTGNSFQHQGVRRIEGNDACPGEKPTQATVPVIAVYAWMIDTEGPQSPYMLMRPIEREHAVVAALAVRHDFKLIDRPSLPAGQSHDAE